MCIRGIQSFVSRLSGPVPLSLGLPPPPPVISDPETPQPRLSREQFSSVINAAPNVAPESERSRHPASSFFSRARSFFDP